MGALPQHPGEIDHTGELDKLGYIVVALVFMHILAFVSSLSGLELLFVAGFAFCRCMMVSLLTKRSFQVLMCVYRILVLKILSIMNLRNGHVVWESFFRLSGESASGD